MIPWGPELGRFVGRAAEGLMVELLPNLWLQIPVVPSSRRANDNLPGFSFPDYKEKIVALSSEDGNDGSQKSSKLIV